MLRAIDVMTKDVMSVGPENSIKYASMLMTYNQFRHLPVVGSGGALVGLLSHGDVLSVSRCSTTDVVIPSIRVQDIMSRDVTSCSPLSPLGKVVATMIACRINCLPVVSQQTLVGIITTTDILDLCSRFERENTHVFRPLGTTNRQPILY